MIWILKVITTEKFQKHFGHVWVIMWKLQVLIIKAYLYVLSVSKYILQKYILHICLNMGNICPKKIAIHIIYKEASGCLLSTKLCATHGEEYKMNEKQLGYQGMQISWLFQGHPTLQAKPEINKQDTPGGQGSLSTISDTCTMPCASAHHTGIDFSLPTCYQIWRHLEI